jgi:hypothetical protein
MLRFVAVPFKYLYLKFSKDNFAKYIRQLLRSLMALTVYCVCNPQVILDLLQVERNAHWRGICVCMYVSR